MKAPTFGYGLDARSSTRLTQADSVPPALVAAFVYRVRRSSDTRIVSQRRSPFSTVGRPLRRFSIAHILYQQNNPCNPHLLLVH